MSATFSRDSGAETVIELRKRYKQYAATWRDGRQLKVVYNEKKDCVVTAMWLP